MPAKQDVKPAAKEEKKAAKPAGITPVLDKKDDKKVVAATKKDEKAPTPAPVKEEPKPAAVAKKDDKP